MNKSAAKGRVFWIAGLVVLTAVLIVAVLGLGSRAAGGPHVIKEGGGKSESVSYTGYVSTASSLQDSVEEWRYVIRANSECNADVFTETAGYNGNLTSIVEGSNVYATDNLEEIERFDGGYICFYALLEERDEDSDFEVFGIQMRISDEAGHYEAGWPEVRVGLPISWDALTVLQKLELNPYDCPEPVVINAQDGRCIVGDASAGISLEDAPDKDPGVIVASIGGGSAGFTIIVTRYSDGLYIARASESANVQEWKYIVWDRPTGICNERNFPQGAPNDVQTGSNYYTASESDLDKSICFAALSDSGHWQYVGASFAPTPQDPPEEEECPEGTIWDGVCVAPAEEGEPCDLGGIGNSEGRCVPCPVGEGYAIIYNSCVPSDASPHAAQAANHFDDIALADSYAAAVGFLLERGITSGCDADSFCPDRQLTRREFITFLYRLLDEPKHPQPGSELFDDVEAGSYADEAIGWAHHAGVTTGCDDNSFCPGRTVTRAHVATFLYRLTEKVESKDYNFTDVDEGAYYAHAAGWAVTYGTVPSCKGGGGPTGYFIYFCPGDTVTRGDAATFIYNFAITSESWGTADLPIEIK